MATANLKSLTPVLIVEAVEPCAQFWIDKLGFTKPTEVPGDDGKLVFAILQKDGVEIMYQTRASVIAETPDQAGDLQGHSIALFITVPSMGDLDEVERAVRSAPVVKDRHKTFYGSTEFYIREPGGNVVGFAAF
ncbi:MAG TPA: VOC family protein [Gemmatimonadaceae bacterium]|jgi:uncharacterized glyoxalase superfamily protein PhnB|nr:VOC family protein [Gemmatimonadaceae bacterium]